MSVLPPADPTVARVEQSDVTKPPVLTPGKVSARVLRTWTKGAKDYFFHKKIDVAREVKAVSGGLRDDRLQDWFASKEDELTALTFAAFCDKLRVKCLPEDWDYDIARAILSSKQGSSTFEDWHIKLSSENALLTGTASHVSEAVLRNHLNANCHPDTAHECRDAKAHRIADNDEWINEVVRCDKKRIRNAEHHRLHAEQAAKTKVIAPFANKFKTGTTSTYITPAIVSASGSAARHLPALTKEERDLLYEFEGCLKCRRFFAGHRRAECPNDFPPVATYKTLTRADAMLAKPPIVLATTKRTVAAVNVVAAVGMSTGVAGNGSPSTDGDSEYVPDAHAPHIFWNCLLDNVNSSEFVSTSALIDNACIPVLIRPELVEQLGLRRFRLPDPVEVGLAMGSGEAGQKLELREWVRLSFSSPDHSWVSRSVRAIVAPGLCAPVILGQSFLAANTIVIDYASRSMVDKTSGYNFLDPAPPSATLPVPSRHNLPKIGTFAAVVRKRIESLAFAEKLETLDRKFKTDYADRFGALPHTDDLPTDVYHRVKLKDPLQIVACKGYASPRKYQDAWE
ncbi:hypothetical protein PLICRDRAFT_682050, partial [Plicaturopsis crispa FD-325 SS-3]